MKVATILKQKGQEVFSAKPTDLIQTLSHCDRGSVSMRVLGKFAVWYNAIGKVMPNTPNNCPSRHLPASGPVFVLCELRHSS